MIHAYYICFLFLPFVLCPFYFLYESNDIWSNSSTRARQRRYFVRRSVAVSVANAGLPTHEIHQFLMPALAGTYFSIALWRAALQHVVGQLTDEGFPLLFRYVLLEYGIEVSLFVIWLNVQMTGIVSCTCSTYASPDSFSTKKSSKCFKKAAWNFWFFPICTSTNSRSSLTGICCIAFLMSMFFFIYYAL